MTGNLWCVRLLPNSHDNAGRSFCVENNILSLGWNIPSVNNVDEYIEKFQRFAHPEWNESSIRSMQRMKNGDLCWTKVENYFWLGQIYDNEVSLDADPQSPCTGLFRVCNWKECEETVVPNAVHLSLSGKGRPIQRISDSISFEDSSYAYNPTKFVMIKKKICELFKTK